MYPLFALVGRKNRFHPRATVEYPRRIALLCAYNMKHISLIFTLSLLVTGIAFGQKVKIKEGVAPANPDSVVAGQGKAALRGAALMNASRDSLRSGDLSAPIAVVDTFGEQGVDPHRRVYLKRSEIISAEDRLKTARIQLEEAEAQLERSKTDPRFKPAEIEAATAQLQDQKTRLSATEAKMAALRKDWELETGTPISGTKDAPKSGTTPKK